MWEWESLSKNSYNIIICMYYIVHPRLFFLPYTLNYTLRLMSCDKSNVSKKNNSIDGVCMDC